jgi:hypothetical protein
MPQTTPISVITTNLGAINVALFVLWEAMKMSAMSDERIRQGGVFKFVLPPTAVESIH